MSILASLRISSRLHFLLAFSVLALLALGGFSSFTIKTEARRAMAFIDGEFESVRALGEVRAAIGNARRYEKDVFLNMGDEKESARYTALWQAEVETVGKTITAARRLVLPNEAQLLDSMLKGVEGYSNGFRGILGQLARGDLHDPWAANKAMGPLKEDIRQADKALADLSQAVAARADERRNALVATGQNAPWLVMGVTALVSIIATILVWAIVHSILTPIADLQAISAAWGLGDLTVGVGDGGADELGHVKRDLGTMHAALSGLVSHVRQGVEVVNANTQEITIANTELSNRTESAAASLQQTASSIDVLSVAVKQTAESATQAVNSSTAAVQVANRGGEVVAKVVATMHEINQSSQKIADIISVIDGIAFQTNILALNAAVEAARAGDQGRGFAVVASEVRSLAGRSADAAREIKAIIVRSVEKVEEGTSLVEVAGQTMREIVESVGQVSTVIQEIRVATREQLEGIDEINTSMGGIDRATQKNAAMVEESAAGAMCLAQEVTHLRQAVSVFKLAEGADDYSPNRALARIR